MGCGEDRPWGYFGRGGWELSWSLPLGFNEEEEEAFAGFTGPIVGERMMDWCFGLGALDLTLGRVCGTSSRGSFWRLRCVGLSAVAASGVASFELWPLLLLLLLLLLLWLWLWLWW